MTIYTLTAYQLLILAALCTTTGFAFGGFIFLFVGWWRGFWAGANDPDAKHEAGYIEGYADCDAFHAAELTQILKDSEELTAQALPDYKHSTCGFRITDGRAVWFEEQNNPNTLRTGGAI